MECSPHSGRSALYLPTVATLPGGLGYPLLSRDSDRLTREPECFGFGPFKILPVLWSLLACAARLAWSVSVPFVSVAVVFVGRTIAGLRGPATPNRQIIEMSCICAGHRG